MHEERWAVEGMHSLAQTHLNVTLQADRDQDVEMRTRERVCRWPADNLLKFLIGSRSKEHEGTDGCKFEFRSQGLTWEGYYDSKGRICTSSGSGDR